MGVEYADQVARKQTFVTAALGRGIEWGAPFTGREDGFRNKAKLVVGGRRGEPTLGILDAGRRGIDLTGCGLYEPGLAHVVHRLPRLIAELQLTPYDVASRNGELKHLLVTHSPDGEVMVRFVLRSPGQLPRIDLDRIRSRIPEARVVSVNLQPEHKAILEGEQEQILTTEETLPMRVNDVTLHLRPQSFFQTNTFVAAGLYARARTWIEKLRPGTVLDLYCGVGGFGLHALGHGARHVVGLESSAEAIRSAERSAADLASALAGEGVAGPTSEWHTGDATRTLVDPTADLVVVNPPRRGIGPQLCAGLEANGPSHLIYSSCNVTTLARDLAALPAYAVIEAGLFDMFPQTEHHEVMVLLERARPVS